MLRARPDYQRGVGVQIKLGRVLDDAGADVGNYSKWDVRSLRPERRDMKQSAEEVKIDRAHFVGNQRRFPLSLG